MAIECVETQEWIEEEISKPIEEWEERQEKKCKKRKWYDPRGWLCWFVTYFVKVIRWVIVKVGKWVVRTVCKVVGTILTTIWDVLTGLWDVIAGIFTLDWRRILDGLIKIGLSGFNLFFTLLQVISLADTILYIYEEYNRSKLRDYVRKLLEAKYSGNELDSIKETLRIDHGAFGYRIPMIAVRTILNSETPSPNDPNVPNLVKLQEDGEINLYELCGFEYTEGFWNRKRYKTLKKGPHAGGGGGGEVSNPISRNELDLYLNSRGNEGPKFFILPMRDKVLRTKLRAAELKARDLGLMPTWTELTKEVTLPEDIKHKGDHSPGASSALVCFLVRIIDRKHDVEIRCSNQLISANPSAIDDLCTPVVVGIFRYGDGGRGLSACLKGSPCGQAEHKASGATFIDNMPDIIRKYIPIHELGHYFGLCHVSGLQRIMYPGKEKSWFTWSTIPRYLFVSTEPYFTFEEAKKTWDYVVEHFPSQCLQGPIIT